MPIARGNHIGITMYGGTAHSGEYKGERQVQQHASFQPLRHSQGCWWMG